MRRRYALCWTAVKGPKTKLTPKTKPVSHPVTAKNECRSISARIVGACIAVYKRFNTYPLGWKYREGFDVDIWAYWVATS